MEVFDRKQWTLNVLINDVNNKRISKSQGALWANAYVDKGLFTDADVAYFEEMTAEPEPTEDAGINDGIENITE